MQTQKGREVYELMKMGAIDGLSVGYRVDAKGYHYDDKKRKRRCMRKKWEDEKNSAAAVKNIKSPGDVTYRQTLKIHGNVALRCIMIFCPYYKIPEILVQVPFT